MTLRSLSVGAALAMLLVVGTESLSQVISANRTMSYNSYTGRYNVRGGGYNTMTGSAYGGRASYNPYTGRSTSSFGAYNSFSGRGYASRSSYNSFTGRAAHASFRRW